MATKKAKTIETKTAPVFSKKALLKADVFAGKTDVLSAVIKDSENLTVEDAQARIDKFMKGKVK